MSNHGLDDFVASRRIGQAIVTIISEGTLRWAPQFPVPEAEWRAAMPDADERGVIPLGINVALVRTGDACVLIDPGCDDPASAWQREFAGRFEGVTRTPGLTAALNGLGVSPEQITHVLITHAHGDHIAGLTVRQDDVSVPRFPRARHFIGRLDWEGNPARERPESDLARCLGAVARAGLLEVVDGDREIVPGITMIPAPGETPGHSIVRVRSDGEAFYYVGDLYHHACEVMHPDWVSPGRDLVAMRASRDRLTAEAAAANATVVFSHEMFPAWGRIVAREGNYQWQRG